ncbi:MAG: 30S ribosomal protein S16 [Candidatus Omnitrophica bacterium]|nr:30S ribosomal protein S16 [Candidatus Omnitrophota bacterium]
MVRIRLRRPGKTTKRRYHFKIVAIEKQNARDGEYLEQLGHYDPSRRLLDVDVAKYDKWIKKGAIPTETVASLYKKFKKDAAKSK